MDVEELVDYGVDVDVLTVGVIHSIYSGGIAITTILQQFKTLYLFIGRREDYQFV